MTTKTNIPLSLAKLAEQSQSAAQTISWITAAKNMSGQADELQRRKAVILVDSDAGNNDGIRRGVTNPIDSRSASDSARHNCASGGRFGFFASASPRRQATQSALNRQINSQENCVCTRC